MAAAKVRFHPTPNPNAGKFVVDRTLVEGRSGQSYESADEARGNPLAEALLALDGVAQVFMVEDFVTVTKREEASWKELAPRVERAITEAL